MSALCSVKKDNCFFLNLIPQPLTSLWIILVIAYTARRLPCTFFKIPFPMMAGGLIAGGLLAFITSSVELSYTIMLVPRMEYGIYIYMQSDVGREAGATLGE